MVLLNRWVRRAAGIVALAMTGSAAAEPMINDVHIQVRWSRPTSAPARVVFEGGEGFNRYPDYFEGHNPSASVLAFHPIVVAFDNELIPLTLRTRVGMPKVPLWIDGPSPSSCSGEDVAALRAVSPTAPQAERIRTLIQARHLLMRRTTLACASPARRPLSEAYFRMSCSLAEETDYFWPSNEAIEQFVNNAVDRAAAGREVARCADAIRRRWAAPLARLRTQARDAGDIRQSRAISDEMARIASDPEWRNSAGALGVRIDEIREFQVRDRSDLHAQLLSRGETGEANALLQQIAALRTTPGYQSAFKAGDIASRRQPQLQHAPVAAPGPGPQLPSRNSVSPHPR